MPPRLNKRQQRELEELEALGGQSNLPGSESTDDEVPAVKNKGVFATASVRCSSPFSLSRSKLNK